MGTDCFYNLRAGIRRLFSLGRFGFSDYTDKLEDVADEEASIDGLKWRVRAIPNAMHYFIARDMQELANAGYEGKTLKNK